MTMTTRLPGAVRQHLAALRALLVLTVLTGVLYPLVVMGISVRRSSPPKPTVRW